MTGDGPVAPGRARLRWVTAAAVVGLAVAGLPAATRAAADPAPVVLDVADYGHGQVAAVTAGGAPPAATPVAGGVSLPQGMALDAAGNLYVVAAGADEIVEDPGPAQTVLASGYGPEQVAVDPAGDVWFTTGSGDIDEVAAGTTTVDRVVASTTADASSGIAVADGTVYAYDASAADVGVYGTDGTRTGTLGSDLDGVPDMTVAGDDLDVSVSDYEAGQGTVQQLPLDGGAPTTLVSGLDAPGGVAVDAAGDLFVVDTGAGTVLEYPAGSTTSTSPVVLADAAQLELPMGIALVPGSAPTAPTGLTVTATGTTTAAVAFTPGDDGGMADTSYEVTATDAGDPSAPPVAVAATAGPVTLTGLRSGDTYSVSVAAVDPAGPSGPVTTAVALPSVPAVSGTPGRARAGTPYRAQLAVTGSPAPTVTVSGALPPGLEVSSTGLISGTPTRSGTWGVTVTATNTAGRGRDAVILTVAVGAAHTLTAVSGGSQEAAEHRAFAHRLEARVTDRYGEAVRGVRVTFTTASARATFAGGRRVAAATTGASGIATSPAVHAGATAGTVDVHAAAPGVGAARTFVLRVAR